MQDARIEFDLVEVFVVSFKSVNNAWRQKNQFSMEVKIKSTIFMLMN